MPSHPHTFTGERISAQEAEKVGLVSKVFPVDQLVDEAVKLGERISGMSKVAVAMAKECVNAADNLSLDEGKLWLVETGSREGGGFKFVVHSMVLPNLVQPCVSDAWLLCLDAG